MATFLDNAGATTNSQAASNSRNKTFGVGIFGDQTRQATPYQIAPPLPVPDMSTAGGYPLPPERPGNKNPYGGVRTGGASVTPGMDQASFDAAMRMITGSKPSQYNYTDLDLPEYNAPKFYDFNDSMYQDALGTIDAQIAAGRSSGNQTYSDAMYEESLRQNPFGQVSTLTPNVRDAMARMMNANGVNPDILAGVTGEGIQADRAFGNLQAMRAGDYEQRAQSNQRALQGDQRRFNEGLDSESRLLSASVQMKLAQAKAQYEKDLFAYGKEEADRRYEIAVAEATTNHTGRNNAAQSNVDAENSWRQGIVSPIIDLINSGFNSAGQQGLDLSALMALLGQ